jgi:hypothetical protein
MNDDLKHEIERRFLDTLHEGDWRQFRDPAALPVLAEALQDPYEVVWKDALDGLVTLGGPEALEQQARFPLPAY